MIKMVWAANCFACWSRSANVNNANNDRNVTSSGANDNNNAYNANYVAPDFYSQPVISSSRNRMKTVHLYKKEPKSC